MLSKLEKFYDEVGILSTNFKCQYYDDCVTGYKDLVKGKSAYVGEDYEKRTLPRILFVSLDMGSDKDYELSTQRTPKGVKEIEGDRYWQEFNPLWHWHATHDFAVQIAQIFDSNLRYKDANRIFAHTNSAKCCPVKSGREMAPARLFKNCKNYLAEELEILNPDILVGQGAKAREAVFFATENLSNLEFEIIVSIHERIHVIKITDHPVLFIDSIFPSWRNDRTRKQKKELYPYYLKAVSEFLQFIN